MWLGQWKNNEDTPFGFKWPKEPILYLGIFFLAQSYTCGRAKFWAKSTRIGTNFKHLEKKKTNALWKN